MSADGGDAEYFDIRGKTAPLVVSDVPEWSGSFGDMRHRARVILLAMRGRLHENSDTGWKIHIGRRGIEKTLNEGKSAAHFQALEKLPELLKNAVLVRKSGDRKARQDVRAYYRLYAPIEIGSTICAAQITVSEDADAEKHFYLQRLQIKKPAVFSKGGDAHASTFLRPAGLLITIPRLLRDVKSDDAPADESIE
jgi:hypothetical protein